MQMYKSLIALMAMLVAAGATAIPSDLESRGGYASACTQDSDCDDGLKCCPVLFGGLFGIPASTCNIGCANASGEA